MLSCCCFNCCFVVVGVIMIVVVVVVVVLLLLWLDFYVFLKLWFFKISFSLQKDQKQER